MDLLALPPPSKPVNAWVLRQVSGSVAVLLWNRLCPNCGAPSSQYTNTYALHTHAHTYVHTHANIYFPPLCRSPLSPATSPYSHTHTHTHTRKHSLPPPCSMQVTSLSSSVARIPYPIPPAGTDPQTWKPEEEPLPLGYAMPFSGHTTLVMEDQPQVRACVRV